MSPKRIEDVLWAFRDRILDLKQDQRFKYFSFSRTTAKPPVRPWNTRIPN